MKIFKKEWFKRRKYGGWGIVPVTWQGYVFLVALVAPFAFMAKPLAGVTSLTSPMLIIFSIYLAFVLVVSFLIMISLNVDERERVHEAIADRNALWAIIIILALGIVVEGVVPVIKNLYPINIFIISGLIGAWLVKVVTILYLDKKD